MKWALYRVALWGEICCKGVYSSAIEAMRQVHGPRDEWAFTRDEARFVATMDYTYVVKRIGGD